MKMKKLLALLLALVMTLSLLALPSYAEEDDAAPADAPAVEQTEPTQSAEPTGDAEQPTEDEKTTEQPTESAEPETPVTEPTEQPAENEKTTEQPAEQPAKDAKPVDFSALTVAQQYAALMAMDEAAAQAAFDSLTAEQQNALTEYAKAQAAQETTAEPEIVEDIPAAVNYDKVAPISAGVIAKPAKKLPAKAAAPAAKAAPTNGISFEKAVTDKGNGTYTIKLEAYTTGTITTSSETKPCDIVLVLDRSTSMTKSFTSQISTYEPVYTLDRNKTYAVKDGNRYTDVTWCSTCEKWTNGCSNFIIWHSAGTKYTPKTSETDTESGHVQFYEETVIPAMNRMEALHYAANSFVSNVAEQSPDSRIAVVSFGQNAHRHTGNSNSAALLTAGSDLQTIKNAINGISANESATEHGKGMELAKNIFAASNSTGRNRVVVLITDGEPAPNGVNYWSSRVVKQTIENAYTMKHDYDATVYCISVMPNTDASNPTSDMDKYMSYVSSNYPNARYTGTNLDNKNTNGDSYYDRGPSSNIINQIAPGSKIDTSKGSFYLTAGNIATLDSIFEQIATQTGGSTVSLDKSAVVRDVVTPYFNMPANSAVTAKSYDCLSYNDDTGVATWSSTGTDVPNAVSISGTTIDVSNFDFNRNFVAETGRVEGDTTQAGNFHGRKLVITFDVTPKDGFLGGNGVPTNESAGVFVNKDASTPLTTATADPVDVAIKPVTVNAADKNVYLTNSLTEAQLIDGATIKCGDVDITDPDTLAGWQKAYVDIASVSGDLNNLTVDREYTITATVAPKNTTGTATAQTKSATANVYVFKPELTFNDSEVYYGDNAPESYDDNLVSTVWKHGETLSTAEGVTMIGTEPTLDITYTTPNGSVSDGKINTKQDIPVKATVKIGSDDVTTDTTFLHQDCDPACGWNETTLDGDPAFLLHVKTCTLTITKSGGADNESYVFDVKKDGVKYSEVTVWGNGTETLFELPVGNYTITENTGWSWRYTANNGTAANLSAASPTGTITCTNTKNNSQWLNGFSAVVRNIFSAMPAAIN